MFRCRSHKTLSGDSAGRGHCANETDLWRCESCFPVGAGLNTSFTFPGVMFGWSDGLDLAIRDSMVQVNRASSVTRNPTHKPYTRKKVVRYSNSHEDRPLPEQRSLAAHERL